MKSVMVFASKKEERNIPALRAALAATGEWGMFLFEPFVNVARSVALALEDQPDVVLVAIDLGGTEGAALKVAFSRAGSSAPDRSCWVSTTLKELARQY